MEDIIKIAFIGHYRENYLPHISAEKALFEAFEHLEVAYRSSWITAETAIKEEEINQYNAFWLISDPGNFTDEAISLLEEIRKRDIPLLATGTAFKSVIVEFVRNIIQDNNEESYLDYYDDITDYKNVSVKITSGTLAERIYLKDSTFNQTNCSFGVKKETIQHLEEAGLTFSGKDEDGDIKIVELPLNHFYLSTLYLPQLNSESKSPSKLITAFVKAGILHFLSKNSIIAK
ncbi:hypothetical protein [Chondrinema litorale]|uniref:hypothetical protein n=1 Tax=Chondrinema litorale TaxID=2994555 RepID=UPI002543BFD1|nr:hypothetical protein [Chondrinema litorale]UZR94970.1 hypothetical protein OQ292_03970 [Chondrinema litorale]